MNGWVDEREDSLRRYGINPSGGVLDGKSDDRVEGIAMHLTSNACRGASNARGSASSARTGAWRSVRDA